MEQEFILLIIFIIAAVFITLLSLYVIRISKNDEPDYPHNHSYRYICGVIGLFVSILFSILVVILFINGDFDPENRLQTKSQQVTSVEKTGDTVSIYNDDDYKIVFDLEKESEEVYYKNKKQKNVRIDGLQILKENFDGIKNNELLLTTNYKITKDGVLKNIQISISKNKNKDDFEIKY